MSSVIAAISTPSGPGGISVIRVSGDAAFEVCEKIFSPVNKKKKLSCMKGYTACFGHIVSENEIIDEAVALVFRAPLSYTGENVVELSCHGGMYVTKLVLRAVLSAGAKPAEPGEFTKRAYLNGRIDLAEAESVMEIISADGKASLNAAVMNLGGHLSAKIKKIKSELSEKQANIEVWTDSPDDEDFAVDIKSLRRTLEKAALELEGLVKNFDSGKILREGVSAAIVGAPNAGKSTLMNMLSGEDRSIVTSVPGTTRDVVEETVKLGGVTLRLADTAGIRKSGDEVESIGIEKAVDRLSNSDLVIAVFDGSKELDDDDISIIKKCENLKAVAVVNKNDLNTVADEDEIKKYIPDVIEMSARNETGGEQLEKTIERLFSADKSDYNNLSLGSERQRQACFNAFEDLNSALSALDSGVTLDAVSVEINSAIGELSSLTGESAVESVVDKIFEKFCVGK